MRLHRAVTGKRARLVGTLTWLALAQAAIAATPNSDLPASPSRESAAADRARHAQSPPQPAVTDPSQAPAQRDNGDDGGQAQSRPPDAEYITSVSTHLMRHMKLPAEARERRQSGKVVVSFSIDGGGKLTRVALVAGSGVTSLDREALVMVRRASPFPPPPDGRPKTFTVPISFRVVAAPAGLGSGHEPEGQQKAVAADLSVGVR